LAPLTVVQPTRLPIALPAAGELVALDMLDVEGFTA